MTFFKFNTHPAPGFHADGSFVVQDTKSSISLATKTENRKKVTADYGGISGTGTGMGSGTYGNPGISGISFEGGGSASTVDTYNPIRDRLEEGSIIEDWIPRDASGIDEMFKLMYNRDYIAGVIVDLLAEMVWSEFDLVGISDPVILNTYRDSMEAIDIVTVGPEIAKEYMVIGRTVSSMIFNKERGVFDDIICHDPSFLRLTPIPIKGFDPKIDLIPSPALRMFVDSVDPRDIDARKVLPQSYLEAVRKASGGSNKSGYSPNQNFLGQQNSSGYGTSGGIPLDPINTLFLPRRTFGWDHIGTSMYTRLITFWALEKALINATMASARRRIRSILHVKAGIDNMWEPSSQEMDNIAGMFIQADEDPAGAVVVTRTGVDTNEVRAGTDFYKWADEWQLLNEGKLRALGANDALLAGDATYSNQDAARQFFMERVVRLREVLTTRIFYNRLFPLTARIHGFKKRTTAELNNKIRIEASESEKSNNITQRQALSIPNNQLIVPKISWHKELVNKINTAKMEVYEKLEEKGVPIKLRDWSAAGGVDLDSQVSGLEADADLRKQVAKWKGSFETSESESQEEEAKLEFIRSLKNLAHSNLKTAIGSNIVNLGPLASFVFWDANAHVGPVSANDLGEFLSGIKPDDNSYRIVGDSLILKHRLFTFFKNTVKAEIAHYLLYRSGLTPIKPAMSREALSEVSSCIKSSLDQYSNHGQIYKLAKLAEGELSILGQLSAARFDTVNKGIHENSEKVDSAVKKHMVKDRNLIDKINDVNLYSGI